MTPLNPLFRFLSVANGNDMLRRPSEYFNNEKYRNKYLHSDGHLLFTIVIKYKLLPEPNYYFNLILFTSD